MMGGGCFNMVHQNENQNKNLGVELMVDLNLFLVNFDTWTLGHKYIDR